MSVSVNIGSFSGIYKIYSTKHPKAAAAARGNSIVASEGAADVYNIQPNDDGSYTISPRKNSDVVWTLPSVDGITQLQLKSANGHPSQKFKILPAPGNAQTYYIISETANGTGYLGFSPIAIPIYPKFYTIVGYHSQNNPLVTAWTLTPA